MGKAKQMKTIIAGSRDGVTLLDVTWAVQNCGWEITHVVSGGARGVDEMGEGIADALAIPKTIFMPNYERYGKHLAPRARNTEMANNAEALIAVWNGSSKGTLHMIKVATSKGLKVFVHSVGKG